MMSVANIKGFDFSGTTQKGASTKAETTGSVASAPNLFDNSKKVETTGSVASAQNLFDNNQKAETTGSVASSVGAGSESSAGVSGASSGGSTSFVA
jgi:hypothetical protein